MAMYRMCPQRFPNLNNISRKIRQKSRTHTVQTFNDLSLITQIILQITVYRQENKCYATENSLLIQ